MMTWWPGDDYFGGAWVVQADGAVTYSLPLGESGLLFADPAPGGYPRA